MSASIPFPKVLRIEPASQCNLACIHCPTGTIDMHRSIMQDSVFEQILHEVTLHQKEIKVIVLYHGGEPLLNKNFDTMVKKLKEINPNFFIKTVSNAMALTLERSQGLIESKLDAIEFSLDGISTVENEFIRRKSDTKKVIANIKQLLSLKKERKSKFPDIFISTTQFLNDTDTKNYPDPNTPRWLLEYFNSDDIKEFKTTYAMKWPHMGDNGLFETREVEDRAGAIKECMHVIDTMTIRADGNVVACCFDLTNKLIMGNIRQNSLKEIWNGSKYMALRKSLVDKQFMSICSECLVVKAPVYLIPKWNKEQILKDTNE